MLCLFLVILSLIIPVIIVIIAQRCSCVCTSVVQSKENQLVNLTFGYQQITSLCGIGRTSD